MLLFGVLGGLAGLALHTPSYSISLSLIKRPVPQTVQTSDTGEAFQPGDLNDATLLATLLASEPLDRAVERAKNGLEQFDPKTLVEASQLEGTNIFFITYHSPFSAKDAISFSNIWADEINAYTKRFQQTEARSVRITLQSEVASFEKQFADINREILEFSEKNEFLSSDSQVAAILAQLGQIDLDLATARIEAKSKTEQIEKLTEQLRRQSPLELQLKNAQEDLSNLRSTYTDSNPQVLSKLQSIAYLEEQIKDLSEKKDTDLEYYTGTPLGNQIYLDIIQLTNEKVQALSKIDALQKLQEQASSRLKDLPGIINRYQALQKKRDNILEGLSLLTNRLKEAEIYASGAPGYWQVFQGPDPRLVIENSKIKAPLLLGIVGAGLGGGLTAVICLLLSHRSTRRSVIECCVATRAPLMGLIPTVSEEAEYEAVKNFWITSLSPHLDGISNCMFWTSGLDQAAEHRFWRHLGRAVMEDEMAPLRVRNLDPEGHWSADQTLAGLVWLRSDDPIPCHLFRASMVPTGKSRSTLENVDYWISIVANDKESVNHVERSLSVIQSYLEPCDGTLAWMSPAKGMFRRLADFASIFLAKKISQKSAS
ncbi:hypothetical protein JIN85_08410 [Luteolibacter pohnpeiensis]|uniref:Tyrosine kinase G-rich domain-containing protein n=2 Tax=Luteolibacter pohnpeiensis TaxID=454153 RepID=A0A934S749_9BACT|nr:hypothetical protein [Luteolibacter pohnpeiensis]